jgi:hypothetical protein
VRPESWHPGIQCAAQQPSSPAQRQTCLSCFNVKNNVTSWDSSWGNDQQAIRAASSAHLTLSPFVPLLLLIRVGQPLHWCKTLPAIFERMRADLSCKVNLFSARKHKLEQNQFVECIGTRTNIRRLMFYIWYHSTPAFLRVS